MPTRRSSRLTTPVAALLLLLLKNALFTVLTEWTKVQQCVQAAPATAEGLAQGFDIDVGIGL